MDNKNNIKIEIDQQVENKYKEYLKEINIFHLFWNKHS